MRLPTGVTTFTRSSVQQSVHVKIKVACTILSSLKCSLGLWMPTSNCIWKDNKSLPILCALEKRKFSFNKMIEPEGLKFAREVIYAGAVSVHRQHRKMLKIRYVKTWTILLTEQHCFNLAAPHYGSFSRLCNFQMRYIIRSEKGTDLREST